MHSKQSPVIKSDIDVDTWLRSNAVELAAEFKRESESLYTQGLNEVSIDQLSHLLNAKTSSGSNNEDVTNSSTDYQPNSLRISEIGLPEHHWAYIIYPDAGAEEICQTVRPLLNERDYQMFYMNFAKGMIHKDIALVYKLTRERVTQRLTIIRKQLHVAGLEGKLPRIEAGGVLTGTEGVEGQGGALVGAGGHQEDDTVAYIESILEGPGLYYRSHRQKPLVKSRVCLCGRHLGKKHLDHRRKENGKERTLRCDYCGRVWPESEWPGLVS